jgi:hypothetical protein
MAALRFPKSRPRVLDKDDQRRDLAQQRRAAIARVRARDQGCCRSCGKRGSMVHHLRDRSRGGAWDPRELIYVCARCHTLIHARLVAVTWTNADEPDGVQVAPVEGGAPSGTGRGGRATGQSGLGEEPRVGAVRATPADTGTPAKPRFMLTGPSDGPPTLADLVALYRVLTGRRPRPEDLARAREILEQE